MRIQIGEVRLDKVTSQGIYPNKTKNYLLPCLLEYGKKFEEKINNVFKVAVGIGDVIVSKVGFKCERHIFILLDSSIARDSFVSFIEWIRDQEVYENDYVFDNIQKSKYHMVVLKFPEKFYDSFDTFRKGKYSEMFSAETIGAFFKNFPEATSVLIKDNNYRIVFTDKLNKWLLNKTKKDKIKPEEWHGELDFPPNGNEVFNNHLK